MKKFISLGIVLAGMSLSVFSQEKEKKEICDCPSQSKVGKGTLYLAWGYNRDWYSKSDIHIKNLSGELNTTTGNYDYYDFTIHDATARDRSGFKEMLHTDLSIPQYNYRLGYFFNGKHDMGIELNFDHAKYIMRDWQTLHVSGQIFGEAIDKDTLINPGTFLHFEHSDGANFLMLNIMKRQRLFVSKNKKIWLSGIVKAGAGPVIPRTQVTLFGQDLNNCFHIAGWCAGVEAGLRFDLFKYIYLEYTGKGLYADYRNVLVLGSGRAHHHFWAAENILVLGLQFPI